jgi:hypothetical protein
MALDLYTRFGIVTGQGAAETMDGAYRIAGKITVADGFKIWPADLAEAFGMR